MPDPATVYKRIRASEPIWFFEFILFSLRARERWLKETVSGGLHNDPAVRTNAQLHSESVSFENGVAVSL